MQVTILKKLAAILLLGIFSFNIFGYYLVATVIESKQDRQIEAAFDQNNYDDAQLIVISQPTNLPYYNGSSEFQRINGEVEIGGVYYKYVKCRINNGMLEMHCLPDFAKTKLQQTKSDFSKMMADLQQASNKKKSGNESKSIHKTFSDFEVLPLSNGAIKTFVSLQYLNTAILIKTANFVQTPEQPPDNFS